MNTHESYVSLETAKMLKESGFDWDGTAYYQHGVFSPYSTDRERLVIMNHNSAPAYMEQYSAPTLDVAQRWLREIRHRSIEVKSFVDGTVENRGKWWIWHVYDFNPPIDWVLLMGSDCRYSTYEEALEAGIKKAIEIILEKEV